MKNLEIHINCVLIDFEDVQVQINTIVNQILFVLTQNDLAPSSSVSYHKTGLVITLSNLENLMESSKVIINILEDHGWLDSVVKIGLTDLLSDRSAYLIPRWSLKKVSNTLNDDIVEISNQPYSNSVNFN